MSRFEREGLLARAPAAADKRRNVLRLTDAGLAAFAPLDQRSRQEIGAMLSVLPAPAQEAVVGAMQTIARFLSDRGASDWTTRHPEPGDIGWVIERHGALYAEEFGFNHKFEALVAQVAGEFLAEHDPTLERAWIAERDGVRLARYSWCGTPTTRQTAPAAGGTVGARPRDRPATGGGMHRFRTRRRLSPHHPVDERYSGGGAGHLSGGRLSADLNRAAQ